jgi:OOP family OmpA-OmpF porin
MKNKLNTALAALFLTTSSFTALAAEESSQGYVGVSAGKSDIDTGIGSLTGTASLDESDTGIKIFAGFNINENFAIEGHYADLGEFSLSGNTNDTFVDEGTTYTFLVDNVKVAMKVKSIGVAGIYKFNIDDTITPFVKLGIQRWDEKITVSVGTVSGSAEDDGTDPFYGLGASVSAADNIDVRAEFERFKGDDGHLDYASVGIAYNF